MENTPNVDDKVEDPSLSNSGDTQDSQTANTGDINTEVQTPENVEVPPDDNAGDEDADDQDNGQQDEGQEQVAPEVEPLPESLESETPVADALVDKPGDEKLRFSAHPRWKELITERNQFKDEVAQSRHAVEQTNALNNILNQHAIPTQEFEAALKYLILKRTDPQAAFRQLSQDYTVLGQLSGAILPEDLQTQVAGGTLDPTLAKEVAMSRATQRYQQWQQQTQGQVQQYSQQNVISQTTSQWSQLKQSVDPDFKPGTKLWTAVDLHLRAQPAAQNAMQAQLNCENAYKQAKEYIKSFGPTQARQQQPGRKTGAPPSRPSSPTNRVVIKNADDAVKAILSGGGKAPPNLRYA